MSVCATPGAGVALTYASVARVRFPIYLFCRVLERCRPFVPAAMHLRCAYSPVGAHRLPSSACFYEKESIVRTHARNPTRNRALHVFGMGSDPTKSHDSKRRRRPSKACVVCAPEQCAMGSSGPSSPNVPSLSLDMLHETRCARHKAFCNGLARATACHKALQHVQSPISTIPPAHVQAFACALHSGDAGNDE